MPKWPPKDYNYQPILSEHKLRKVEINKWKTEPELDNQGFKKVFEIDHFKGIFKDS